MDIPNPESQGFQSITMSFSRSVASSSGANDTDDVEDIRSIGDFSVVVLQETKAVAKEIKKEIEVDMTTFFCC